MINNQVNYNNKNSITFGRKKTKALKLEAVSFINIYFIHKIKKNKILTQKISNILENNTNFLVMAQNKMDLLDYYQDLLIIQTLNLRRNLFIKSKQIVQNKKKMFTFIMFVNKLNQKSQEIYQILHQNIQNQSQNFILNTESRQRYFELTKVNENSQYQWDIKITVIIVLIDHLEISKYKSIDRQNQIFKFQILTYQKYKIQLYNIYTQNDQPAIAYWFEYSELNSQEFMAMSFNYEKRQLINLDNPIIYSEDEQNFCFLQIMSSNTNYSIRFLQVFDRLTAKLNQKNILTYQRMFVFFNQYEKNEQFINVNIQNQDLFIIPCFENLIYYNNQNNQNFNLFNQFKFYKLFDVMIHVNKFFRLSESYFDDQIQILDQTFKKTLSNKKMCLQIVQQQPNYEKSDKKNYFTLEENEQIVINLNHNELLSLDEIISLKNKQRYYFLIQFKDYFNSNNTLIILNNNYLFSNNPQIIVSVRYFDQDKQYKSVLIFKNNQNLEINLGQTQFIEVDIFQNITLINFLLVKETVYSIIQEQQIIDFVENKPYFILKRNDYNLIIYLENKDSNQINYNIELSDCDILIHNYITEFKINKIKLYKSNQYAGFLVEINNPLMTTIQVQYVKQQSYYDLVNTFLGQSNNQKVNYQLFS
ncbi:hypothetical protein TTHERM_000274683 (macronuclear) [Tetrahymena thermophila SB210]|uniref:Uncharacterized protein n=1 Tax=Tetrahymena thermophila (strain SB210) TaxID=312017 RepID=W7XI86_TETTS|nr:hypothetical protein TTHERM_000274683 [Tetrahymena thermophila SB210]EWS74406.1 hypothetical protein TTHERM_000274683 [Tetrahymena thermophila SB210]|eukprot:XP_012653083.1 hypothetical protein TTHERM_000274683 [Tetrahymena thermophila SB210]